MNCITIFSYEEASEWSKQFAFASDDNEEDFTLDEWEEYVVCYWFAVTKEGWGLYESLEEAIIGAFDMLGFPFDEADLDMLYGIIPIEEVKASE